MASAQCYKTCEQSCQQKNYHEQQQHSSIGRKVTDLFGLGGHHNRHANDGTQNHTQCYSQTEVIYQPGHVAKHQTNNCNQTRRHNHSATGTTFATGTTTAAKCQQRNRREHKRNNMFQRMKDGVSGHNSDSGSSSDESDSDNENRCNRKAGTYITSHKKIEHC